MCYSAFSCADVADNTVVGEVCRRKPSRQAMCWVGHVACGQVTERCDPLLFLIWQVPGLNPNPDKSCHEWGPLLLFCLGQFQNDWAMIDTIYCAGYCSLVTVPSDTTQCELSILWLIRLQIHKYSHVIGCSWLLNWFLDDWLGVIYPSECIFLNFIFLLCNCQLAVTVLMLCNCQLAVTVLASTWQCLVICMYVIVCVYLILCYKRTAEFIFVFDL